MKTTICEGVYRVGAIDWFLRDFHGYDVKRGVTYNSYLVRGSAKTALIDAVKAPFVGDLLANLAAHGVTPADLDYVVVNHAELDHAGGLEALVPMCTKAEIVCDAKCKNVLSVYFDTSAWNFRIVKEGESLSLGDKTLAFVETPMAHWPESMATYLPEDQVLFSMDAFGQHYPTYELFDEDVPLTDLMHELKHYYANILQALGKTTAAAVKKALPLSLRYICPSHGVVWHKHIGEAIAAYQKWSAGVADRKVVVCFDTMWRSTELMAKAVAAGAAEVEGTDVRLISFRSTPISDIMTEVLEAGAIALGTPTQNNWYMPTVGAFLTAMLGLRTTDKLTFAFGSSGWAHGGADKALEALRAAGLTSITENPVRCLWKPTPEILEQCREAGRNLAKALQEKAS